MRKPKHKSSQTTVSPSPALFKINGKHTYSDPQDLKREISTNSQTILSEGTILYGEDDALPLRIALAVEESPAASSCIGTIAKFIKGSGFSDPELMKLVVDKDGTTLWDLHSALADSLALFWGFAINFKFNRNGKITNCFQLSFESCRFKAPGDKSPYITQIVYNPYFGTQEKRADDTKTYSIFNVKEVKNEIGGLTKEQLDVWGGQVYYYGKTSPLSRFYPKPKYWSAKEAIQADHKLQEFTNEELDNGFFQSVLINAIGDPNKMSSNPATQVEYTDDAQVKRTKPSETIGQEFNRQMAATFSGSKKAGTALVLWSQSADSSIKVQAFPTTINSDRIIATQDSITKTITIATEVPGILANISEGVSLGSDGNEIQKSVELMQSRTVDWRTTLENFYNTILLPNKEGFTMGERKVEITSFTPVSEPIEIDDHVWQFLNEAERVAFIKRNMPHVEIIRTVAPPAPAPAPAPVIDPNNPDAPALPGEEATAVDPNQDAIDALIRGLSRKDLAKFYGYVNDYKKGRATLEQTKVFLRAFKLSDEQIMLFLNDPEGDGV